MLAYRALQRFLGFVVGVFYRRIEVVGLEHVPAEGDGPVIFAGNHPNSLLDPVLIIAVCGRVVHFAAKDVLFRSAPLRVFLKGLGAVPIARRMDHGGGAVDNADAFEGLLEVLGAGRAMGIFPEGISHDDAHLSRLKTGAARIAFAAFARHPGRPLRIVPCGLNYTNRRRFRSSVLVQFGPPIVVDAGRLARHAADEREEVRALTDAIDRAIRALTINSPDWDTLRVLDGVRRLYQPPRVSLEERTELARRFAAVYETVRDRPEVVALFGRVRDYLDRLRAAGVTDRDLHRAVSPFEAGVRLLRHAAFAFVWLPLALPGAPLFVPAGLVVRVAAPVFAPRKDVLGTTKFVLGLVAMLALFAAVPLFVAWRWGARPAALAAVALLVSGLANLRVAERVTALKDLGRIFLFRRELDALRAERAALEHDVTVAVDRLRPADMVPLFESRAVALTPEDLP